MIKGSIKKRILQIPPFHFFLWLRRVCCLTDVFKRSLSIVQRMATQGVGLVAVTTGAVGQVRDSSATKTGIHIHKWASFVIYFYKTWLRP